MEKSISQQAVEAAMKTIEREQGIKLMYRCVKNDKIKPLPDTFEELLNHDQTYRNMSRREFIIRRELHLKNGKIYQAGLDQIEKDKEE